MPTKIHISDLREPQLSDLQKMARDYGESLSLDMSSAGILQEAMGRTGLDDFGPMDFVGRLDMWLDEVAHDDRGERVGRESQRLQFAGLDLQTFVAGDCDGGRIKVDAFRLPAEAVHEFDDLSVAATDVE